MGHCGPDKRITARADSPTGVESATIVSSVDITRYDPRNAAGVKYVATIYGKRAQK
tara:strand:- start:7883 stop:8050 length:168 start_codon:yes stop_codon:yes gene_type:complete